MSKITPLFSPRQPRFSSKQCNLFLICILFFSIPILLSVLSWKHETLVPFVTRKVQVEITKSSWFEVITKGITGTNKIKVGLVNFNTRVDDNLYQQLDALNRKVEVVSVHFDHVNGSLKWEDFFPEWINEDSKLGSQPKCPEMPMPQLKDYGDVNVVVARVPCGVRDVFRLQVNLVVGNLAAENGWVTELENNLRKVYVVFIGSCGPMVEIFRCDDLLMHEGEYWVYEPDLKSLKQQMLMPVGSCQIAPGYSKTGKELWRPHFQKFAYVTILHSSEAYVCGAIALAHSIPPFEDQNHPAPDLLLLVDNSIGRDSIRGLKAAGWKIKHLQNISNPFAQKDAYNNEWNYSKLQIWQLTMYEKIIFIDPNVLILKNIENFFAYPQLSAAPDEIETLFNSGFMIIEPSQCMFDDMMQKIYKVQSYNNEDDQDYYLNEIFTWWHRLSWKMNYLKYYKRQRGNNEKREVPKDVYGIHYFGLKPWMCYRDYDCNWDVEDHHIFASDSAHQRWWQVYDAMPKKLQSYCGLTKKIEEKIMKQRAKARNARLINGHWKIEIKDPRRKNMIG
ncbi:hypothetical protein RIF29_24442 [Crotalaria pallida]|uniref:Hexosyltransferase n=1 Tax=Crotalaria pallida TaxID=3830 RepID=A0AAN9EJS2_CROPI